MNKFIYLTDVISLNLDTEKCTGCRMCMTVCPHAVFGMESKKAVLLHRELCMECGACARNCPQGAITVKTGVGCAAGILNGLVKGTEPSCDCSSGKNCC